MNHFSIAGLQLELANEDSLALIAKYIASTKKRYPWLDMIVLSELASFGIDKKYAEPLPNKTEDFYCQLAKEHDIWLIPGSLFERDGEHIYNTTSIINNKGEVVDRYRKIFPFYPYEQGVECGSNYVVFDVPQGRIGIAICYDLWFPEVARALTCLGAEMIIYPTLTGTIDRPQELILAQATAIQNQCYVLAVNAAGSLGNGQSIAVGPQGDVLYQAGSDTEVLPIEVDFSVVRRNRERGLLMLGQPLKSFRDNKVAVGKYSEIINKNNELNSLGELKIPASDTKKLQ
ncbi:carbon-nitrogen hydrolase family protein [Pseudoalteromonas sp. YIC-656]|uniref:carbon-nitrogen hydrolase family protein n=1 Tax=Pseudoalteromonas pernae TaxID=3118054 RepID=UPI003241E518